MLSSWAYALECLAVALGGGIGAALRFEVESRFTRRGNGPQCGPGWSPLATLTLINALGSLVLGLTVVFVRDGAFGGADFGWTMYAPLSDIMSTTDPGTGLQISGDAPAESAYTLAYYLFAVGLCGGFTTFSSVMVELFGGSSARLALDRGWWRRLGGVVLMTVACVAACFLGGYIASWVAALVQISASQ